MDGRDGMEFMAMEILEDGFYKKLISSTSTSRYN